MRVVLSNIIAFNLLLVDISEVGILTVRQIFKGMNISLILLTTLKLFFQLILSRQVPPESDNNNDKQHIATHVCSKRNEVPRAVPLKEDLRQSWSV